MLLTLWRVGFKMVKKKHSSNIKRTPYYNPVYDFPKYVFLLMCSILVYFGLQLYKDIYPMIPFDSFVWSAIIFLLISFLIFGIFRFKFQNEIMWISVAILIVSCFGIKPMIPASIIIFTFGFVYEILCRLGLGIETKVFWRNKRILT